MKTDHKSATDIRQQRSAWFKERLKPGMTTDEAFRLNEEALHLFPPTEEERRQKTERLMSMPEFVLRLAEALAPPGAAIRARIPYRWDGTLTGRNDTLASTCRALP